MKYSGYFYLIWPRPEGKTGRKIRKAKAFGKKYSTWRLSGTAGEGIRYGVSGKTARFRLPMYSRKGTAMSRGGPQAAGEKGRLGRRAETLAGEQFSREETAGKEKSQFVKVYFYKLVFLCLTTISSAGVMEKLRGFPKFFWNGFWSL